jgi:nucleotide-binding universal stress UspA family protein
VALKDLLVYVDQSECAFERLRLAADLARRHRSRLTALFVNELTAAQLDEQCTAELGLASAVAIGKLNRRIDKSIADATERLRSALESFGREHALEVEWRCLDGVASILVPQHARYADLCILSHETPPKVAPAEYSFSEHLLFVTGRPVLFIPTVGVFETLGRHILVAWNSSRASARAVNDALKLIERAERTTVLTVNPREFVERHGALPAKQMVEHLRRHSASVEGSEIGDVPAHSVADVVQAEAHRVGADLVVAGAFGYPRLWEKVLGGVTRDLLARMNMPTFMSH